MRPIDFPEANAIYRKPKGWTDEQCMSVSAMNCVDEAGNVTGVVTAWQPNKEDIQAINEGRPIYLNVSGAGMPPVSLFTLDENGKSNEI